MNSFATRPLLAATLGLLAFASLSRALTVTAVDGPVAAAREALAEGDFAAAKTALDPHLATAPADTPTYDDARILRAFARFGLALQDDFPALLRTKLGAQVADLDLATGDLALRFPRPPAHRVVPGFTTLSATHYAYGPAIDLYAEPSGDAEAPLPQPGISFENTGPGPASITFTVSQPGPELAFDSTLYLDGLVLGFVNAYGADHPFEVFIPPAFEISNPDIPEPFDLDGSTPDHFLRKEQTPATFTVSLPPQSTFTIGLVYSAGDVRFTLSAPLPSRIIVRNGRAGAITAPRIAPSANFNDFARFAAQLRASTVEPIAADLEAVSESASLVLTSAETGHAQDVIIAYPDVQILLAETKFIHGLQRLSTSYDFAQPIKLSLFDADLSQTLARNPRFLAPLPASSARAADRLAARNLFEQAIDHYLAASEHGLWTRPAPESGGTYFLFIDPAIDESEDLSRELIDDVMAQLRLALREPAAVPGEAAGSAFTFAPLFGSPAVHPRAILPVFTDGGIVRGSSTAFLARGFFVDFGTADWEHLLGEADFLDLETPPIQSPAKIQRQPAAFTRVAEGEPAALRVIAECYPPPAYQWFRRVGNAKVPVQDANTATLSFEAASREDAGVYLVEVTNTRFLPPLNNPVVKTVTSSTALLQVTYAPEIVTPPVPLTRLAGTTARFTVVADAVPAPSYQWVFGDAPVAAARNSILSFKASTARAGNYSVHVANSDGTVTTTPVTLTVHERPRFTLQPVGRTVSTSGAMTFTAQAVGNPAPSYQWYRRVGTTDTPIEGATAASYTINPVAPADAGLYVVKASNVTVNAAATGEQANHATSRAVRLVVTAPAR